ncbi:hypothetical protein EON63_10000 [archaeon]|nr:MAG: hypothetical protein EON63_10000 [archaeon]
MNLEELLAILAHEMGHWRLWHSAQNFVVSQLYTLALLGAFSCLQHHAHVLTAFGFQISTASPPVFVALLFFTQTFWAPVDKGLSLLMTINSRRNEFAADRFAAMQGGRGPALVTGLIKLSAGDIQVVWVWCVMAVDMVLDVLSNVSMGMDISSKGMGCFGMGMDKSIMDMGMECYGWEYCGNGYGYI